MVDGGQGGATATTYGNPCVDSAEEAPEPTVEPSGQQKAQPEVLAEKSLTLRAAGHTSPKRCSCGFVAGLSNFSVQYNYACAGIAAAIMLSHSDETGEDALPDYPEPQWAKDFLLSVVFIGSVLGMFTMGYLGDRVGVPCALAITNSLAAFGALSSALLSWGGPRAIWGVITASRFVLGIGVGGNYPLSAAKAAQEPGNPKEAVQRAARAFWWQGPGSCSPYVLALFLLSLPRSAGVTSLQFRTLLGAGAIGPLVVVLTSLRQRPATVRRPRGGVELRGSLQNKRHWRLLVGTAGTWFLFDVAFYGTVIFAPTILAYVFGDEQTLTQLSAHAALMSIVGIAGTGFGVWVLPQVGAKRLNTAGFVLAALLFAAFARVYASYSDYNLTLFLLLCSVYFVLYSGPNVATYVLPVLSFPADVLSTFHGLSSAAAKVGAMVGAILFPVVDDLSSVPVVMATQAGVCLAGALVSHFCLTDESVALAGAEPDGAEPEPTVEEGGAVEMTAVGDGVESPSGSLHLRSGSHPKRKEKTKIEDGKALLG